jgi:LysM repeat protein
MGVSTKFIKFGFITALFCLPVFVHAQNNDIPAKVNGKKYYKHIVEKGETVYGIAKKYNEQPKDIVLDNPNAIDGVHPGDTLLIPMPAKHADTSSVKGNYIYHDVVPKETRYSLAKQYGTTVSAIDSLNPGLAVKGLQIGQRIRIPRASSRQPITTTNKLQTTQAATKDTTQSASQKQVSTNKNEAQAYRTLIGVPPVDTAKHYTPANDTGKKLNIYNIALIMPFAAEGADTLRLSRLEDGTEIVPTTTQISVDFYHGIIIAFDSLAKKGFRTNLQVFNVSSGPDSSSHAIDSILRKPEMLSMNLIIGPPYPSTYRRVARFAGLHHIAIVSPLSVENSVLKNNPWTSKITPSPLTETEIEAEYIAAHYSHDNIILIHNKDANDEYYQVFKKHFQKADSALGNKDSLRHAESIGGVKGLDSKISKTLVNVIIMPYQGAPFVAKFVNELANSKYSSDDSLIVFGMHNWANNDALAADNLDTLNFHFPSNEFVKYTDLATKRFIAKYRNDYLSEPSYFSYEGYDAAMFYGNLLYMHGTDIQNHLGDTKYRGLQTSFDMSRSNSTTGFENKAVYILEYKNYTERLDSK